MCTFFFFNDPATTEIYPLSLHDALPIFLFPHLRHFLRRVRRDLLVHVELRAVRAAPVRDRVQRRGVRSEEHTSELQSRLHLVCRLLLEKKNTSSSAMIRCTTSSRGHSLS